MEMSDITRYYTVSKIFREKLWKCLFGGSILILLPYIHIHREKKVCHVTHLGVIHLMIWVPEKPQVNRKSCSCSCFDTVFRGTYQDPGNVGYKHIYFNATAETFKIWTVTVIFLVMCYESMTYLCALVKQAQVRKPMLVLFVLNIYPHYYSWWMFFNYYNDDFYRLFNNQVFFTITEVVSGFAVLNLCDSEVTPKSWKIMLIVAISLIHILVSSADQFIMQVFQGQGKTFLNVRNFALMIPDIVHILIALHVFVSDAKRHNTRIKELVSKKEVYVWILVVVCGTLYGNWL